MQPEIQELTRKENNLLLFAGDKQEIYILGTLHNLHLSEEYAYSLAHISSTIRAVQPDVLLIEARQETLDRYGSVDGPFEMIFAYCLASETGIPVRGIDWWSVPKNQQDMYEMDLVRDDKIFEKIIADAKGYKKILALCGASHRARMPGRFASNGYIQKEIKDFNRYFDAGKDSFVYPQSMPGAIRRKIDYNMKGFADEVSLSVTEGDELYAHWTGLVSSAPQTLQALLEEAVLPNKLFRT